MAYSLAAVVGGRFYAEPNQRFDPVLQDAPSTGAKVPGSRTLLWVGPPA